ncbi:MAG TPA: MBL fold metallo-hydrolase [Patescibacteria group bacterium]|nr:MBL fold metallo-hydrolase [Patescibacteria group bacterium]
MKITFLGTNGWYDTPEGNTPCILIDTKDFYLVLDAGNGLCSLNEYLKKPKPVYLFLSHLHLDHIIGLHCTPKLRLPQGLKIYVPKKHWRNLHRFFGPPFTGGPKNSRYGITMQAIKTEKQKQPLPFVCLPMTHFHHGYGFRFQIENKIIAYSGDTSVCDNDQLLAQGADLLIHECSLLPGRDDEEWGHSGPNQVAALAKNSRVQRLVLTHFLPVTYPHLADRNQAKKAARKIFPATEIAYDRLELEV